MEQETKEKDNMEREIKFTVGSKIGNELDRISSINSLCIEETTKEVVILGLRVIDHAENREKKPEIWYEYWDESLDKIQRRFTSIMAKAIDNGDKALERMKEPILGLELSLDPFRFVWSSIQVLFGLFMAELVEFAMVVVSLLSTASGKFAMAMLVSAIVLAVIFL